MSLPSARRSESGRRKVSSGMRPKQRQMNSVMTPSPRDTLAAMAKYSNLSVGLVWFSFIIYFEAFIIISVPLPELPRKAKQLWSMEQAADGNNQGGWTTKGPTGGRPAMKGAVDSVIGCCKSTRSGSLGYDASYVKGNWRCSIAIIAAAVVVDIILRWWWWYASSLW